jgi:outer membrane cobalamin receptor
MIPNLAPMCRGARVDLGVLVASAISLTGFAPAGLAQDARTGSLPSVTIVGSRLPITPSGLAQNVTVIDAEQIRALNPGRIEDILSQVGGVYVDSAGKTGGFSSLYRRGG